MNFIQDVKVALKVTSALVMVKVELVGVALQVTPPIVACGVTG